MEELRAKQRECQVTESYPGNTEKPRQRRKPVSCPTHWVQAAPTASGKVCPQAHSARIPSSAPRSPPHPHPSLAPAPLTGLARSAAPQDGQVDLEGRALLPAARAGFPEHGGHGDAAERDSGPWPKSPKQRAGPSGPSGATRRPPWHSPLGPVEVRAPRAARAERAGFPQLGPRGWEEGPVEPSGRGCPELAKLLVRLREHPAGRTHPADDAGEGSQSPVHPTMLGLEGRGLLSLSGAPPHPAGDKDQRERGPG